MNSCMWSTVHLSIDEGDFKRNIPNLEVQRIQTFFETVQAQITNVRLGDHETCGLSGGLDRWSLEEVLLT